MSNAAAHDVLDGLSADFRVLRSKVLEHTQDSQEGWFVHTVPIYGEGLDPPHSLMQPYGFLP